MNFIFCHKDCKHQQEGTCQLEATSRVENATLDDCCYYIQASSSPAPPSDKQTQQKPPH